MFNLALLSAVLPTLALAGDRLQLVTRQQQDANTPLFLNEPACDFYQCAVYWTRGTHATANWLNAPDGDVVLDLLTDDSTKLAYHIATVPGVSSNCDAGNGEGNKVSGVTCGGLKFTVPSAWSDGNYTMRATSKNNENIQSYTDVILIQSNGSTADVPFATVNADGTTSTSGGGLSSTQMPTTTPTAGSGTTSAPTTTSTPAATGTGTGTKPNGSMASSPIHLGLGALAFVAAAAATLF